MLLLALARIFTKDLTKIYQDFALKTCIGGWGVV